MSSQKTVETVQANISSQGYGDIFASVYETLKKKEPKNLERPSTDDKSAQTSGKSDNFVGIEYDPGDNYFYLVGNDPSDKMALFENQGMKNHKAVLHNFVINPVLLRTLKQDFQLDALFQ